MNKGNQLSGDGQRLAESVERRGLAEGNTRQAPTAETQGSGKVSRGLLGVREAARRDKNLRFTALLHHIDLALLQASYEQLKRTAAPGVDGVRWTDYQEGLEGRLEELHDRIHKGSYRALPSKRARIAKEDGSERKLGIAALEDKIVQQAVATVLNAIYEEDFKGFSYGFRPGRDQHQALDALYVGLTQRPIGWVVDLDIRGYFDSIRHDGMVRFLEHRIADRRMIRLIRNWLRAGVIEDRAWHPSEEGSPQGAVISPLVANIYLHYVFDLWAQRRRRKEVRGAMTVVRYADDIVVGFQHHDEAKAFLDDLSDRLNELGLTLHPDKTRLIEFGRQVALQPKAEGTGKPATFTFLGVTHLASKTRTGR
jgi:group II intron reverse transcriptase/maturase